MNWTTAQIKSIVVFCPTLKKDCKVTDATVGYGNEDDPGIIVLCECGDYHEAEYLHSPAEIKR